MLKLSYSPIQYAIAIYTRPTLTKVKVILSIVVDHNMPPTLLSKVKVNIILEYATLISIRGKHGEGQGYHVILTKCHPHFYKRVKYDEGQSYHVVRPATLLSKVNIVKVKAIM